MAYITIDYYKTDFLGTDPGDDTVLQRLINRASDMVDLMTQNKSKDYDDLPSYQQDAVQQATAYQTEYLVENGDVFSESFSASERIGSWSVGGSGGSSGNQQLFSKVGMSYLEQNGLMFAGIPVGEECETDIL